MNFERRAIRTMGESVDEVAKSRSSGITEESAFKTKKEEFDELKRKLVEELPKMEERLKVLKSQIASIDEEISRLRAKKEPLQKECEEIIHLTFGMMMDLPLLLKYEEIKDKVRAVAGKFLGKEDYDVYAEDDWIGIAINMPESVKLKTLSEIARNLSAEFNIPEEKFMLSPLEQRGEINRIELGFSLSE